VKIKRFVAKDMRLALLQIKEQLGADAVIMSQKKIPEGVELMAAVDYNQPTSAVNTDASLPVTNSQQSAPRNMANDVVSIGQTEVNQSAPKQSMTSQLLSESETAPVDSLSALLNRKIQQEKNTSQAAQQGSDNQNIEQQFKSFTERLEQKANRSDMQAAPHTPAADLTSGQHRAEPENSVSQNVSATQSADLEIAQMRQEMMSIRQLLEHQVSGLMWQDMAQKDPSKALMVNRLMSIGLNTQVAEQVSDCIPTFTNENEAWLQAKALLSQQLNTTNNDIIRNGGVVSLVGPTGVGKTTTVAKIAARFAQIHGADSVVMISTDNYRIAGFEQLSTYGRIIGCQVKLAKNATVLESLLQQYHDKKLVLIDTAGMGQRDIRLTEHLTTLITSSRVRIRNYLVLAANTQQQVMQENVERFKKVPLAGCIYTKLDESLSVGEIIATSIQNGLAIGYLTDGQRVPEDIKVANAEKLVTLADRLAEKVNKQYIPRPMPIKRAAMV
jgi:flagellar biosynthesis protein FlhF